MALIKNANASQIARDAIVLDLGDLRRQGEQLTAQARARADQVVAEARAERERIIAGAAEKGHAAGLAQGLEEGRRMGAEQAHQAALMEHRAALGAVEGAWKRALEEFSAARDEFLRAAERDVVRLAVTIAERVIKRAVAHDPEAVVAQVREVLAVVVRPTELVLRVHPDDHGAVERALPGLVAVFPAIKHVELADDPALERGSCTARMRGDDQSAGGGEIDASIRVQMDRIVEAILPGGRGGSGGGETGAESAGPPGGGGRDEP